MFIKQEAYTEILRTFPINAVELLIHDQNNNVLMFKRANEPAKNQWWIPGGRVLHGESRMDAAKRLLKNECGITFFDIQQFEMFEYTVENHTDDYYEHMISTVYQVKIVSNDIEIDSQTSEYCWQPRSEWIKCVDHNFLKHLLNAPQSNSSDSFFIEDIKQLCKSEFIRPELYDLILKSLSIPCVDILISNFNGEILLVKRKNEPAKNKWWVPGGRVHFGEKRMDAAKRKLRQECGINCNIFTKIGDFEFVFRIDNLIYHDIATLYGVTVSYNNVLLDDQSFDYSWKSASDWLNEPIDDFIRNIIKKRLVNNHI